ncbi:acyl-CoA carboxylase subunit epsilon [Streptomyces europaeiscabiei]|uniref:acyl-CoA carboxylase subunit epsilon n=1 Tax=Streptomyces europaeiscabiei TaxID=146819 RepID=UPI002E17FDE2
MTPLRETAKVDLTPDHEAAASLLIRVERGHAETEELAAVTVVLLARSAGPEPDAWRDPPPRVAAAWRRPHHHRGFCSAHTWSR